MMYVPSNSPSMYEVTMEGIELNSSDSALQRIFLRRREKEENAKPIKNRLETIFCSISEMQPQIGL